MQKHRASSDGAPVTSNWIPGCDGDGHNTGRWHELVASHCACYTLCWLSLEWGKGIKDLFN